MKYMFGRLAQLVEHQSYKLGVVGSNPSPPTRLRQVAVAERLWRPGGYGHDRRSFNVGWLAGHSHGYVFSRR